MLVCAVSTLLDKVDSAFIKLREDAINTPTLQEFKDINSVKVNFSILILRAVTPFHTILDEFCLHAKKLQTAKVFFFSCHIPATRKKVS